MTHRGPCQPRPFYDFCDSVRVPSIAGSQRFPSLQPGPRTCVRHRAGHARLHRPPCHLVGAVAKAGASAAHHSSQAEPPASSPDPLPALPWRSHREPRAWRRCRARSDGRLRGKTVPAAEQHRRRAAGTQLQPDWEVHPRPASPAAGDVGGCATDSSTGLTQGHLGSARSDRIIPARCCSPQPTSGSLLSMGLLLSEHTEKPPCAPDRDGLEDPI